MNLIFFWKPVEFRLWGNQSVAVRFPEIEMLLLSDFNLHCGCMGGSFFKSIWCFFIYYNFKNIQTSTLLPTLVVNLVMAFFLLTLGSISWKGNTRTYLGFFTACRDCTLFSMKSHEGTVGAKIRILILIKMQKLILYFPLWYFHIFLGEDKECKSRKCIFFCWIWPIVQDAKFKLKGLPFHRYCNKYPKPFLMSKKSSNRQNLTC